MKKPSFHKQEGCPNHCDISHKIWLENHPDDPILDGEVIHHKDGDHDNNEDFNQQKTTNSKHCSLHAKGKNNSMYKKGYKIAGKKNGNYGGITEEHKQNIIKNHPRLSGKDHPCFGKKHSEKTKQLLVFSYRYF